MQAASSSSNDAPTRTTSFTSLFIPAEAAESTECMKMSGRNSHIVAAKTDDPVATPSYTTALIVAPKPVSPRQEDINTLTRLTVSYKEMAERYHAHLREATMEAASLREENAMLREANKDLTRRLSTLLTVSTKVNGPLLTQGYLAPSTLPSIPVFSEFQRLSVEDDTPGGGFPTGLTESSPTSVLSFEESPNIDNAAGMAAAASTGTGVAGRITLPKSISIRSAGFLKMSQASANGRNSNRPSRVRVSSPVPGTRVRVTSGTDEDPGVEVEAFKQGMFKTELCNKWQQSGECPYGDHCQFAHGMEELRPVIRHPRYKTELCRMVVAGDTCPYGHRCHFRHALTEEEKGSAARVP